MGSDIADPKGASWRTNEFPSWRRSRSLARLEEFRPTLEQVVAPILLYPVR